MKIKLYFAVIILASLFCGFFLEYIISEKQSEVISISNEVVSNQFMIDEYDRFQNDLNQYFISVDLILGSGESYLISGALKKSKLLSSSVFKFKSKPELFENVALLLEIENHIKEVNELVKSALDIRIDGRELYLSGLLLRSDNVTAQLALTVAEIKNQIIGSASNRKILLKEKENQVVLVRIFGAIVFGIILVMLWIWSYKRVCNPLYKLKHSAEESMGDFDKFESIVDGPKEVVELSNSLAALTTTLTYQASHDSLTQLYNRREFERKLEKSVASSDLNNGSDVLCYLDLDQFKIVNDSCGHVAGDELLKVVANVIREGVRGSDFVARVGGDEFCILLYKCDRETAVMICNKIRDDIENIRYAWDERVFRISVSVGITEIYEEHNAQEILNIADTACSVAKDLGRNRVHTFSASDTQLARKRSEMSCINQIHMAIEEDRFILYRQDIVSLDANMNTKQHFEVLIRMLAIDNSIISPYVFLPTAERYHLATKLDKWVVSNVFRTLTSNPNELDKLGICNINLSGQSFSNKNMADYIIDQFIETGMPAEKICFEITETAAVTDIINAKKFIEKLKAYGCLFALDDFGSGLSSFQYLKDLPVDIVKIDGAFVKNMATDQFDVAAVKSIHDIAKASGKQTVAEFVENKDILDKLELVGVDYAQGYYFGKPMPMTDAVTEDKKVSNW